MGREHIIIGCDNSNIGFQCIRLCQNVGLIFPGSRRNMGHIGTGHIPPVAVSITVHFINLVEIGYTCGMASPLNPVNNFS